MAQGSRRRGRIFIYLGLILILGLVLVWAVMRGGLGGLGVAQNPQLEVTPQPQEEMVDIVITTQPVPRGSLFTEAVLTTIRYPKREVIEGTFYTSLAEVVGKAAKIDISPRVPVTTSLVVETTDGSFAAFQIPQGMVAIPIPINSLTSISYAPQPGDHVNVIVSMMFVDIDTQFQTKLQNNLSSVLGTEGTEEFPDQLTVTASGPTQGRAEMDPTLNQPVYVIPSEPQRPRLVSQTLLQDAVVLQVGLFPAVQEAGAATMEATPTPDPAQASPEAAPTPAVVERPTQLSLIVTPQDAVTLSYLVNNRGAKLTLALRGAGDEQRVQTEAVTLQYLMDQYNIPLPAKLPYATEPRVDGLVIPTVVEPTQAPE